MRNNREKYFKAMGIGLDPVSVFVEDIEGIGYIMKRIDYGLRDKPSPELENEIESMANEISNISISNVDPTVWTFHTQYKQLDYNRYQIALMRASGG
jgi:hypothetical protein